MISKATTPEKYIQSLPENRQQAMMKSRKVILKKLSNGVVEERMDYFK